MKIVVCDDDALVYEQMKNIIASYSIVKNENLELTFYQTVEELLHAKHMFCEKLIDMGVHKIMLAGLKKVGRANENLEKIALTPLEYQSLIDRLKESKVITGINDEYRKLAGDEAESNIRIDIPVPYSGVCPYFEFAEKTNGKPNIGVVQ